MGEFKPVTRKVAFKGRTYTVVYDSDRVMDTVTRDDGKAMSTTNTVVKDLLKGATELRIGYLTERLMGKGYRWAQ